MIEKRERRQKPPRDPDDGGWQGGDDPDDDNEPRGEFMMVGPDGEVSDLPMHAELLGDEDQDLKDEADALLARWDARQAEIDRENAAKRIAARAHGALAAHRRNR